MVRNVKFLVYSNGNIFFGDEGPYYDRDPLRKIKVKTDASFQNLLDIICTGIRINPTTHQLEVIHRHPIFSKTTGVRAHYTLVPIIDNDDMANLIEMAESMGESCTQELFIKVHDRVINSLGHGTPQEPKFERSVSSVPVDKQTSLQASEERLKKKVQEEKEHKKKEKVAHDEDLAEQNGKDIFFDLVDHDKVSSFHVPKELPFKHFKYIAKEFGIAVQFQRNWLWTKRINQNYRPHQLLTQQQEALSVEQLRKSVKYGNNAEPKLFLEVEHGQDLRPIAPPKKTKEDILLFFKLYDPQKEELRYMGRLLVKTYGIPEKILARLNEMAGYSPDQEIELYEEPKFERSVSCVPVDKQISFQASEESMKKEQEEKEHKTKEKAEAHLYTIIKVACDEDLAEQIGKDIFFDLVDHDKVRSFHVPKELPFEHFKEEIAKEFGIPVQFQRYWLWTKRINQNYRPHHLLTQLQEALSVEQLRKSVKYGNNAELKLLLEVELGPDLRPIAPPDKTKEDILLFFKLYDPQKEELRYVGRLFVKTYGIPEKILARLNEMAGYSPDQEIELYEELKFERCVWCEPVDKQTSFQDSELEDGDIICFQKAVPEDFGQFRFPDVPSFLEYLHNHQV